MIDGEATEILRRAKSSCVRLGSQTCFLIGVAVKHVIRKLEEVRPKPRSTDLLAEGDEGYRRLYKP